MGLVWASSRVDVWNGDGVVHDDNAELINTVHAHFSGKGQGRVCTLWMDGMLP